MTSVTDSPKSFWLFGYPIAHSASPAFHMECFRNLGVPHHYEGWSTTTIDQQMMEKIHSPEFGGAAITMPLKTAILQHLDDISPSSKATRACNTIVLEKQADGTRKLIGTNTDVLGVKNSLLRNLRNQHPQHSFSLGQKFASGTASGLVIGGGATTRSAVYALSTLGLAPIFLINRDEDEIKMVLDNFKQTLPDLELIQLKGPADVNRYLGGSESQGEKPGIAVVVGAIPAIAPITAAERLVYTTVAHLLTIPYAFPNLHQSVSSCDLPFPIKPIFLDMAYKPRQTPMLRMAFALGWEAVGGVQAMIEQGLAQQRMWKVGSASDEVASGRALPDEVEVKARLMVEAMNDVTPVGLEVDRSKAVGH